MEARKQRIVESAVELAEQGGFEAVRLRDVAAHAEVALGTLYRRFRSKEAILVAALALESERLERRMSRQKAVGATPLARVTGFFDRATPALFRRPNLTRAILRAVVSGDPQITEKAKSFHERTAELVTNALKGDDVLDELQLARTRAAASVLQQVWFAALVGWMGGLHGQAQVTEQVRTAAELILGDDGTSDDTGS